MPVGVTQPDKYLIDQGLKTLEDENWLDSREYFRQIIDGYPQSAFRAEAKLGLADTYLGEGTDQAMVLAVSEYREFLAFFPTHPRADYAQHRIALSYFGRMRTAERDQTPTLDALREFQLFVERYPNSPLMPEVREQMRQASDRLSESGYRVGLFYYRVKWYPGAIERFQEVLRDNPDYTARDAVYFYLAESMLESGKKTEALSYFELLIKEFEQSEFLEDAWERVVELQTDTSPQ